MPHKSGVAHFLIIFLLFGLGVLFFRPTSLNFQNQKSIKFEDIEIEKPWQAWQIKLEAPIAKNSGFPAYNQGLLFLPIQGNKLVVLDAKSGQKKWEDSFADGISGIHVNSSSEFAFIYTNKPEVIAIEKQTGVRVDQKPEEYKTEEITVKKEGSATVVTRKDARGNTVWKYSIPSVDCFPIGFRLFGDYVAGLGYCDDLYTSLPVRSNIYILNAKNGKLIAVYKNLGDATFDIIENTLLVFDKTVKGYNLPSGQEKWSHSMSDDEFQDIQTEIVNKTLYAAKASRILAIDVQSGGALWSQKIEGGVSTLRHKNNILYIDSYKNSKLYALNSDTGKTIWQANNRLDHVSDAGDVFLKDVIYGGGFTTNFYAFDSKTLKPIKIFGLKTFADTDLKINYADPYIYVYAFEDDFVAAIKYRQ